MDLNDFIFRDDSAESLGSLDAEAPDDGFAADRDTSGSVAGARIGLASLGAAGLGLSHMLGQITRAL